MDPQLVLLFFQILDRLVLLFQRFVRRKDVRGVELQSEGMLPAGEKIYYYSLWFDRRVRSILKFSGLCKMN